MPMKLFEFDVSRTRTFGLLTKVAFTEKYSASRASSADQSDPVACQIRCQIRCHILSHIRYHIPCLVRSGVRSGVMSGIISGVLSDPVSHPVSCQRLERSSTFSNLTVRRRCMNYQKC